MKIDMNSGQVFGFIMGATGFSYGDDIDYVDNIAKDMVDHFNTYLLTLKTWRGGYSDRFVAIFKELQDNIIARTSL